MLTASPDAFCSFIQWILIAAFLELLGFRPWEHKDTQS
jgi:hypothetical protein